MADMDREQRRMRGDHALRLIEDDLLQEVFAELDAGYVLEWRTAETPEERERAWTKQRALADVQRKLHTTLADGQYAQVGMERKR